MFRDTKEELKRLEEELLQEEETDAVEDTDVYGEEEPVYENYDPNRVYNTDRVDEDPDDLSEELLRPRRKGGLGVAICLLLLAAALLLVAATVLHLRG